MSFSLDNLQAVIVDLDGTLVDTLGDFDVALNRVLREMALPAITRRDIEMLVGKGSEHLIRSMLAQVGAAADRFDDAWQRYLHHYTAINGEHSDLYAGALEGLQALKARGLKLACLTNKPTAFALPLLKLKGVDRLFEVTFGGDAFERKKPDPLPLLKTCEALGTAPSRTLMVGDSSNDARAARAAGCPVVLVTYGYNHGEPVQSVDADGYVGSIAELVA